MKRRLILTAMAVSVSAVASASVTSLITMPIADILGHREAEIDWSVSGSERRIDTHYWHAAGLNIGVADRMELSVDNDFLGSTTFHGKLSLYEQGGKTPFAVSAGFMNFEGKHRADAFLVARADFSGFRLHAGWIHNDADRLMVGADFPIRGDWSGAVEYTSGPHGYAWVATSLPISGLDGVTLTVAMGFPSTRADGMQHYALLAYGFRF